MKKLIFIIFILTGSASFADDLKCTNVPNDSDIVPYTIRCENSEVICYFARSNGMSCKFKK